jgi:hypothetical protein
MGTWGTWNNVHGHGTMDMVIVGHRWTLLDIGGHEGKKLLDIVGHCWTLLDIVEHGGHCWTWRT